MRIQQNAYTKIGMVSTKMGLDIVSACAMISTERFLREMLYRVLARNTLVAKEESRCMQWAVLTAAFLASAVEFVEALTIVLVVGVTINWRSSLVGAFAAAVTLAVIVGTLGVALVEYVPIVILRLVVGIILVLFGLKWLKKAILRYSGLKAIHDEEAIFEEKMAELRTRGETTSQLEPFGVALSYKSVLLEGLEVAFIVITFGSNVTTTGGLSGIASAAIGAAIAGILVIGAGVLVRAPLKRVPDDTLKFVVGILLPRFAT